jgi:predicted site-specific integrase-resolvase
MKMKYLAPTTIAERYDMSAKSIHRMIDRGELPAVLFPNGKKRVSEEALEKALRRSTRQQTQSLTRVNIRSENGDSQTQSPAVQSGDQAHKSA